ncbi:hypothetical protein Droror1_Dr00027894 [Drosera rotundifolia]
MGKELGLCASSVYFVRVGKNYSQIHLDIDAMNLYKHVDRNRIVHVYATVDAQVDVQHSGPSTSYGMLRRSPRKQQRISQLEGERGIQIDAYDPYSSSSPDDDPFYPDSEWDGRDRDDQDYDTFVNGNEQDVLNYAGGSNGEHYDSMANNIEGLDEDDMPSDDLHNLDSNSEEGVGDCTKKNPIFNEKTDFDNPVPGRPKKARRREPEEPDPVVLSKRGVKMSCRGCGREGHNKRGFRHKDEWDAYAVALVADKIGSAEKRNARAKENAAKKVASAKQKVARRFEKAATDASLGSAFHSIIDTEHQAKKSPKVRRVGREEVARKRPEAKYGEFNLGCEAARKRGG